VGLGEEEFPETASSREKKGRKEGGRRGKGWGCSLASTILIPKTEAFVGLHHCVHLHTHVHTHAFMCCLSALAWIGVHKSADSFNNSQGDVAGKREGNSRLFLAGCGYLLLTRPARRQALCR